MKVETYQVVDVQELPKEIKAACFVFFSGYPNDSFIKPHIDGCEPDSEDVPESKGVDSIYTCTLAGDEEYQKAHDTVIRYLFKSLNLNFDDVFAWDRVLVKYWW